MVGKPLFRNLKQYVANLFRKWGENIDFILNQDSSCLKLDWLLIWIGSLCFFHAHVTLYEGLSVRPSVSRSVGPSPVFFYRGIQAKK